MLIVSTPDGGYNISEFRTEGLIIGFASPEKEWLKMVKHPADRAERLKINEQKKKRNRRDSVEEISDRPVRSVSSDAETE